MDSRRASPSKYAWVCPWTTRARPPRRCDWNASGYLLRCESAQCCIRRSPRPWYHKIYVICCHRQRSHFARVSSAEECDNWIADIRSAVAAVQRTQVPSCRADRFPRTRSEIFLRAQKMIRTRLSLARGSVIDIRTSTAKPQRNRKAQGKGSDLGRQMRQACPRAEGSVRFATFICCTQLPAERNDLCGPGAKQSLWNKSETRECTSSKS